MTDPRQVQEDEYAFPYHYIPERRGGRVRHSIGMDWAAEYLNGIELVETTIQRERPASVCDVGCGDGRLINELAPRYLDVEFRGVDFSERAVQLARLFSRSPNACFSRDELTTLPREYFGLVTLIEVLEHIPPADAKAFLVQVYSLVEPGGAILMTVPHANVPLHRKHFRHFTGESLRVELREAVPVAAEIRFMGRMETGLERVASRLIHNRYYSIELLVQWRMAKRLGVEFVPEQRATKVVASVRKPARADRG